MKAQRWKTVSEGYTHADYRKAKVIHLRNDRGVEQYFYRGREITREEADRIVARETEKWEKG